MKKCSYCGDTEEVTKIIGDLCRRHYLQNYRHGKMFKTIYEPNDIENRGCHAVIITRDKSGNKTGELMVDLEAVEEVSKFKWYSRKGYGRTTSTNPRTFLHQMLVGRVDEGFEVDHIDGNPSNNRAANLRVVTHKVNAGNMRKGQRRGVKVTPNGKFASHITHHYRCYHLGTFNTFDEAKAARRVAELKYFGEYVD